jgi:hypothetical protein
MREYLKYLGPKGGIWSLAFWWAVAFTVFPIIFYYYAQW